MKNFLNGLKYNYYFPIYFIWGKTNAYYFNGGYNFF